MQQKSEHQASMVNFSLAAEALRKSEEQKEMNKRKGRKN